jgi:hypothetical protein
MRKRRLIENGRQALVQGMGVPAQGVADKPEVKETS